MIKMNEIIIKKLEEYIQRYAEYMYYIGQINAANSEQEATPIFKRLPDAEIHRGVYRRITDELYREYEDDDDKLEEYENAINDATKAAKKEACRRAEAMRQANGIYINRKEV